MTERINKDELVRRLAARMQAEEATATAWLDGIVETLYESFKAGESLTFSLERFKFVHDGSVPSFTLTV